MVINFLPLFSGFTKSGKMKVCKSICKRCPFSKEAARGWLGPHSVQEIMDIMQFDGLFSCHMTRDDECSVETISEGKYPLCRGYIASATISSKLFRNKLKTFQEEITDCEKKEVLNRKFFIKHHTI